MKTDESRLEREAEFFDRFYAENAVQYNMAILDRYRRLSARALYSKEYRLHVMGDLAGKRVVDIGCGAGENAVLLALLGARVTGIDVSPVAIEKATALARSAGVADRVDLRVQPFETFEAGRGAFDIVWVDAFLHHVIPVLDDVMRSLTSLVAPGGRMVIAEPVRVSAILRALRGLFPASDATPDERPLEQAELDLIGRHLVIQHQRLFHGVARLSPMFLGGHNYEGASPARRALSDLTCRVDAGLLRLPVVGPFLGGTVTLVGTPRRA